MYLEFHRVLLLVFLCGWMEFSNSQTARPITCTAGDFSKCEVGFIQCNFNKDVNKTRHDFNIVHYPFKSTSSTDPGTYVLLCNWQQNGKLECKVEDGFSFNYVVTSMLTLEIPDVSRKVEGKYVCQLVPDGGIPVETCPLTVIDGPPPEVSSKNTQIHVQTDHDHPRLETLILVLIVAVVFLAILVITGIVISIKNGCGKRQSRVPKPPHPSHEQVNLMPPVSLVEGTSKINFRESKSNFFARLAKGKDGKKEIGENDDAKEIKEMTTTPTPAGATTTFDQYTGKPAARAPNTSLSQALDETEKNLDALEAGEGKRGRGKQQGDICTLL